MTKLPAVTKWETYKIFKRQNNALNKKFIWIATSDFDKNGLTAHIFMCLIKLYLLLECVGNIIIFHILGICSTSGAEELNYYHFSIIVFSGADISLSGI